MKSHLALMFILMACMKGFSQSNAVDTIKSITISEKKVLTTISLSQQIDTALINQYAHSSLQQLLQYHTNIMVRNYGVGGISTISIRGSSAAQTSVLWNGVNINNALTGISDFNALPVSFFDDIKIEYGQGNNSSVVGGSIHLANRTPLFNRHKSLNVSFGYESLKNYSALMRTQFSTPRFSNSFRAQLNKAKNQYAFFNEDKNSRDTLQYANSNQYQFLNDMHLKIKQGAILSWHSWGQYQQRNIPATTFEDVSAKKEGNITFRTLVKFERQRLYAYKWTNSLGCFIEDYQFYDSLLQIKAKATVLHIPYTSTYARSLPKRQRISAQLSTQSSYLLSGQNENLRRLSAIFNYSIDGLCRHFNMHTFVQKEWTNVFSLPLISSLSINGKLLPNLSLYSSISSAYRTPTLNELYYFPGGNKNLKPEESKNIEVGAHFTKTNLRHHLSFDGSLYHRKVKNWITWFGSSILTPHNILQVDSKGIEVITNYSFQCKKPRMNASSDTSWMELIEAEVVNKLNKPTLKGMRINCGFLYAYTLSTTEESAFRNDYSIGKQIPYVPRYQAKASIGFSIHKLAMSYVHTYTGYRFVTSDESQFLKPYSTGNIHLDFGVDYKLYTLRFNVRCNNLYNTHFESIVGRVMPERNVSVGITFSWH